MAWGETDSTWYVSHQLAYVPAPDDKKHGVFGGMRIGKGNSSTQRKFWEVMVTYILAGDPK